MAKSTRSRKKIGKYSIHKQIGKGSAANIYLAEQETLGRKIVIKELLPQYADNQKMISRFKREAKVVSKLSHEAIVHMYDTWIRGSSYYIAMEYIQGKTLAEILAKASVLPVHIAAVIVYQICRGLEHAHGRGVVHRDLKPSNIIISNTGQVKILDFGIAHFQYDEDLTSLGAVLGTYHYMSPEQALGKKVSPASDIFSLGILFYELLTGLKPFLKDEKGDVLEKIVHNQPKIPGKINPSVPIRFNRIVRKCLRKKPARRYDGMKEMKKKLEFYLRRYSLDHQMILQQFLQDITPRNIKTDWPPTIWNRIGYRVTHQRPRVYVTWILVLAAMFCVEFTLIRKGISLQRQWVSVKETARHVTASFFGEQSRRQAAKPANLAAPADSTEQKLDPEG